MPDPKKKSLFGKPPSKAAHLTKEEARAGRTPHVTRYVLTISTGLAVVALLIVLSLFW